MTNDKTQPRLSEEQEQPKTEQPGQQSRQIQTSAKPTADQRGARGRKPLFRC